MKNIPELTGKDLGLKTVRGRLLKAREVAAFLRVSERWVEMHMNAGTFPVGEHNRLVDSADLEEWLSKILIEAGTAPLPLKAVRKIQSEPETKRTAQ
jgi:predicted DNA-binding transcriptional regulator AlpA